jgi:uncharacterized protein (TIGR00730 family)
MTKYSKTAPEYIPAKHSATREPKGITVDEAIQLITSEKISEYDRKLILNTLSELYKSARLFQGIRDIPKVTVFGSARTKANNPDYKLCKDFSKKMVQNGYMVITGGGPGIMAAGNEGAGAEHSVGLNISLPFEQSENEFVTHSQYLITYNYFFSRKLMFVREADAIVLFPGGFGTMDEGFEVLTLVQTGRAKPMPIVLMEQEGGTYWEEWLEFVKKALLKTGLVSPDDMYLFRRFHNSKDAVEYINGFYTRFHSLRYVEDKVVIRMKSELPVELKKQLTKKFADIIADQGLENNGPLPGEIDEPELAALPRIVLKYSRDNPARLFRFLRAINGDACKEVA